MLDLVTVRSARPRRPPGTETERVQAVLAEADRLVQQVRLAVRRCRETLELIAGIPDTSLRAHILRLDFGGQGAVGSGRALPPEMTAAPIGASEPVSRPDADGAVVITDSSRLTIGAHGRTLRLTPTEWQLLMELVRAGGAVTSRGDLAQGAWGTAFREQEVEVYVCRLRRKLNQLGARHVIETVRGRGYRAAGIR